MGLFALKTASLHRNFAFRELIAMKLRFSSRNAESRRDFGFFRRFRTVPYIAPYVFCREHSISRQKFAEMRSFFAGWPSMWKWLRGETLKSSGLLKGVALRLRIRERKSSQNRNFLPERERFCAESGFGSGFGFRFWENSGFGTRFWEESGFGSGFGKIPISGSDFGPGNCLSIRGFILDSHVLDAGAATLKAIRQEFAN